MTTGRKSENLGGKPKHEVLEVVDYRSAPSIALRLEQPQHSSSVVFPRNYRGFSASPPRELPAGAHHC